MKKGILFKYMRKRFEIKVSEHNEIIPYYLIDHKKKRLHGGFLYTEHLYNKMWAIFFGGIIVELIIIPRRERRRQMMNYYNYLSITFKKPVKAGPDIDKMKQSACMEWGIEMEKKIMEQEMKFPE
jgi:hypothetical protein